MHDHAALEERHMCALAPLLQLSAVSYVGQMIIAVVTVSFLCYKQHKDAHHGSRSALNTSPVSSMIDDRVDSWQEAHFGLTVVTRA